MTPQELMARLADPFPPEEVKWKPQAVSGNRALAIAYVDARLIMDRLDEVFGIEGWQDHYEVLEHGSVSCRLSVRIGEEWVTREDVGSPSEQPDEGDRMKAAYSDALKRAAVKVGIGRYLYRLPMQWVEWDATKKKFVKDPSLPTWARPDNKPKPPSADMSVLIDERQCHILQEIIEEKRINTANFWPWASDLAKRPIEKLDQIPAAVYPTVLDTLKRRPANGNDATSRKGGV